MKTLDRRRIKKIGKLESMYFKVLKNPTKYPNKIIKYIFRKYMKSINGNFFINKKKNESQSKNFLNMKINPKVLLYSKYLFQKKNQLFSEKRKTSKIIDEEKEKKIKITPPFIEKIKKTAEKIKTKKEKIYEKKTNYIFEKILKKKKISKVKLKKEKKLIQIKKLNPILVILKKIWLGQEKTLKIQDLLKCQYYQLLILKSIIKRKFGINLELNNFFITLEQLKKINTKKKYKREDEKVKYIFNKFIDLIKTINKKNPNFYDFFFKKYLENTISEKVFKNYFKDSKKKMIGVFYNIHFVQIFLATPTLKKIFLDFYLIFKKKLEKKIKKKFLELLLIFDNFFIKDYFKFRDYLSMMENKDYSFRLPWDTFQIDEAFQYHFQSANFNLNK